ncbi:CutC family protein [Ruaniaceae bacterium KH17]|nr:CutC family protein [Ruaniaceae bacterium KH17]
MKGSSVKIEFAIEDLDGVMAAHELGADRVELCTALEVGGLTPSIGLIRDAAQVGIPIHPLIRVRPGGGSSEYYATDPGRIAAAVQAVRELAR